MTDKETDIGNTDATAASEEPTIVKPPQPATAPAPAPVVPPKPPKSGRGLAALALLVGLGAGGGSGYLWYLWQQDQAQQSDRLSQAVQKAIAQRDPEFKALQSDFKKKVEELAALQKQLETLKAETNQTFIDVKTQSQDAISRLRSEDQDINAQLLAVTGDLQPTKNALELQKGETQVVKTELGLLRDGHTAHKELTQKQYATTEAEIQKNQTHLTQLDEETRKLQLSLRGLEDHLETVKMIASQGGDANAFPLAETEYLLRLADTKLELEQNVDSTREALIAAQKRLDIIKEPGLTQVQKMLAESIASLRGVKLPDISGLAHKLMQMGREVGSLPLKINSSVPDIKSQLKPATTVSVSDDAARPWWERTGEAVWNQFRGIVIIRHQSTETPPLIPVENEFFLRQNTKLELESMRMALLRGDAQSYQDSYARVHDWVEAYFDTDNAKVKQFLTELQTLHAVQFNPYIPDLTGLNLAFRDFMNQRQPMKAMREKPAPSANTKSAADTETPVEAESAKTAEEAKQ